VDRYVVFYRITKEAVEIVRVLDERRDVDAIFDA
jgi:plasmid stabilization system protein ParE